MQTSLALFSRIFEYLDLPVDMTERARRPSSPTQVAGEVRFEHVSFGYEDDERPTLDRRRPRRARRARSTAIVGETGSGKTTLGYLVARLYDADRRPRHDRRRRRARPVVRRRSRATVGLVSQETYLFHASDRATTCASRKPDATDEELEAAARAAQIHDLIASLPDGYDTVVGERGYRFSGGEKQRIAIARTILRNPPVLVLDEATQRAGQPRPSARCRRRWTGSPRAARRSRSPTACRPSATPTRSSCSTPGGSPSAAPTTSCCAAGGRYAALLARAAEPVAA